LFWLRPILATHIAPAARVEPLRQEANELVSIFTATVRKARLPAVIGTTVIVGVVLLTSSFYFLTSR
jgi:hypothetical protein